MHTWTKSTLVNCLAIKPAASSSVVASANDGSTVPFEHWVPQTTETSGAKATKPLIKLNDTMAPTSTATIAPRR